MHGAVYKAYVHTQFTELKSWPTWPQPHKVKQNSFGMHSGAGKLGKKIML